MSTGDQVKPDEMNQIDCLKLQLEEFEKQLSEANKVS